MLKEDWKWVYKSKTQGEWQHTFTQYFKVRVDKCSGKEISDPIEISYAEYNRKTS